MDDLFVHSLVRTKHIEHLNLVFEKFQVYRIPIKCKFMVHQGKILGHIVSQNGMSMDVEKIKVTYFSWPINTKGVQIFTRHCGYYHRFIYMYAKIAKPLFALLIVFEWWMLVNWFTRSSNNLWYLHLFKSTKWDKVFHAHIFAFTYAIGYILAQPHD